MTSQQFCTFLLGGNLFGVPVPDVQEVIRFQQITPVPLAPAVVAGMLNLRGQIVMAIDLRKRLGLESTADTELPVNVVVRTAEGVTSLLADEIREVVEASDADFEPPPETLEGGVRGMVVGVHKLQGKLLHVLDIEKVCQVSDLGTSANA